MAKDESKQIGDFIGTSNTDHATTFYFSNFPVKQLVKSLLAIWIRTYKLWVNVSKCHRGGKRVEIKVEGGDVIHGGQKGQPKGAAMVDKKEVPRASIKVWRIKECQESDVAEVTDPSFERFGMLKDTTMEIAQLSLEASRITFARYDSSKLGSKVELAHAEKFRGGKEGDNALVEVEVAITDEGFGVLGGGITKGRGRPKGRLKKEGKRGRSKSERKNVGFNSAIKRV
ncbi:hypothetical protein VNO78_23361 [Psophocarpus tetragonolobus]|uniref:Uncharacterized protein n=1 Tax=Psophocarpus tetragonolobus TaxID=3891 RepID=A0AAN9XDT0_PSOTE